ncbi:hypothetical protein [Micromonospora sp. NPDC048063]|uniref:hypothetical protein n=1 Tax=Micromonospora sp. NPDC048063 TaxID=3364256 RepID=UPI0037118B6E
MDPETLPLSDLPNPYEFANPVTSRERFAGRSTELKDLRYYLRQARRAHHPVNIALVGERAAGKTSLLNVIEHDSKELGLLATRINLNSGDADPMRLFWKIYEAIVDSVSEAGHLFPPGSDEERTYRLISDGLNPEADHIGFPLRFPAHYAVSVNGGRQISENKLVRDLVYLYEVSKVPCVLLFDECNVLATNRVTLEMLRNVFMNTPGYMLVLTGTPAMFPLFDDVFSPIIRQFKKVRVQPFEELDDSRECIDGPLKALNLKPYELITGGRQFYQHVHQLSGGRPYEIQLLCHFMFRRVQDKRAERMALTANVIDDVMQELELSVANPGTSRPVLAALRTLNEIELKALGVLGRCSGFATFDDIWFAHSIEADGEAFTREELIEHLRRLSEGGVLEVRGDAIISFLGDDFERVYLSYFAESRNVNIRIQDRPFAYQMMDVVRSRLRAIAKEFPIGGPGTTSWVLETIEALLAPTLRVIPPQTDVVYDWVLEAAGNGDELVMREFVIQYGSHVANICAPIHDEDDVEAIERIAVEIAEKGGSLDWMNKSFKVPASGEFIQRLLDTGDRNSLLHLGEEHTASATFSYLDGERQKAIDEAELASRFPLDSDDANNVGYMLISAGKYDKALQVLKAIEVGGSTGGVDALLLFNLAIASLGLQHVEQARTALSQAAALFESVNGSPNPSCLFIPSITEHGLCLVEILQPELREAISGTQRLIDGLIPFSGIIEVRHAQFKSRSEDQ